MTINTRSLILTAQTKEEVLREIEAMGESERRQVSPEWLALVESSLPVDPWIHGFAITLRDGAKRIGKCGFTGPPGSDGIVEIAYAVDSEFRGRGYATEAAMALTSFAFADPRIRIVRAHTLPHENASTHVLTKCGFARVGESIDHEVGVVWRWEKRIEAA